MAQSPPPFPDPDAWRRMLASIRLSQQQLRELLKVSRVPQQQLRALVEATRLSQRQLRAITDASAIRQDDLQKMIEAARISNEDLRRALRDARIPDERWRDVLRSATLTQGQFEAALASANLSKQQWEEIIQATRLPQRQLQDVVGSLQIPGPKWQETLDVLREVDVDNIAEAADDLKKAIDAAEPEADPEESRVSWLLNLPFAHQLGLYLAVLKALDELGKFLETTTNGQVSPELRAVTQVLFAVAGVLLMVIQLRAPPPGDD